MTGSASEPLHGRRGVGLNPYVGPRPFEPGEKLYGREDEITDLYYLWNAERIVLLHSPSGAGKSSLLQAGLMPQIRKSFDVWGPTRVNQEPAAADVNRYLLSAMQGFEEGVPERLRRPAEELAGQTFAEYVEKRPRRRSAPKNVALLFDQFEEILTVDPLAVETKRQFFDQLGELLHNPRVWALFALREDFLAPLDPYARQVPTHLKNRFRIDMLGLDGAREAIVNPALAGGREFPAADRLVQDLATMKVQQPDGSFRDEAGHYVEPVQLQVVCFRLWDEMPAAGLSIDAEHLARFGDVTEALAAYYADSVSRLAEGDEARERAIREWFGEALITTAGIRGQVLRGAEESEGLANEIIERLLDTHLVRAEKRAGATWYELAHDRLIEPVRDDNAAWRAGHLSEVQQRSTLWERQGRPPGLVMKDEELAAAERWAAGAAVITGVEQRFLDASREAQAITDRERRQTRRIKWLAVVATVVGALALVAGVFAVAQMIEAEKQRQEAVAQREEADRQREEAVAQREEAESQREEAESQRRRAEQEKLAADAARREAVEQRGVAEEQTRIAEEQESEAQAQRTAAVRSRDQAEEASAEADRQRVSSDEQRQRAERLKAVAEHSEKEARRLQRISLARALTVRSLDLTGRGNPELAALLVLQALRLHREFGGDPDDPEVYQALRLSLEALAPQRGVLSRATAVQAVALAADGGAAAYGTAAGEVGLVRLGDLTELSTLGNLDSPARTVAWSTAGNLLAAGSLRGALRIWDLENSGSAPRVLTDSGPAVLSLAFHPAKARLAAGDAGGVTLWDLAENEPMPVTPAAGNGSVRVSGMAWSGDGTILAAALGERGVALWTDPASRQPPRRLGAERDARSLAWSRDSRWLAVGRGGGTVALWRRDDFAADPLLLAGHGARVNAVGFHPRREVLASASADGSLRLWDVRQAETQAVSLVLEGHDHWVWGVAFSPDGDRLVSASADRTLRLWLTRAPLLADELCRLLPRDLSAAEWEEYLSTELDQEGSCQQPAK